MSVVLRTNAFCGGGLFEGGLRLWRAYSAGVMAVVRCKTVTGGRGVGYRRRSGSARRGLVAIRKSSGTEASPPVTQAAASDDGEVYYECELPKPLGAVFRRGNDGRAYIADVNPARGSIDPKMEVGDKIVQVSASFGPEVWEAENYGQVAYAIRTRAGNVYLKMLSRKGDLSCFEELARDDAKFRTERAGGNYGAGTVELQRKNYAESKELGRKRNEMFEDGLEKYVMNDFEGALILWEDCVGLEPKNYLGDDFARTTDIYRVAQYNIACCYSQMDQVEASLETLEQALKAGFEDYDKVRNDPGLAKTRMDSRFNELIDKFDEPWINMNAINAIKGLFGGK